MLLGFFAFILALFIGYKWGKEVSKDEEQRKNWAQEPLIFTLQHDVWEKTQKYWRDFINSLETEDVRLIMNAKDNLINATNQGFDEKIEELKRAGNYTGRTKKQDNSK